MFVWGWGVHTTTSQHVGGGHRTTFGSWLSPPWVPEVGHRLSGLCGKGLYPLRHLSGLTYTLRKEFRFGKLMYVVKLSQDAWLCQLDGSRGPHCCS